MKRNPYETYILPTEQQVPKLVLKPELWPPPAFKGSSSSILDHDSAHLLQSVAGLHQSVGSTLENDLMLLDPFYAITEILRFSALAEAQFLKMVAVKLDYDSALLSTDAANDAVIALSRYNVMHYRKALEAHLQDFSEMLDFIKQRQTTNSWPRYTQDPPARSDTESDHERSLYLGTVLKSSSRNLQRDVEYIVKHAENLLNRCERNMALAMNNAGIAETKRGMEQSRNVFRFTLLATFYVPLSFTATFFGMNFRQFGQGHLGLNLYAIVSIPVFLASAILLFVDFSAPFNRCVELVLGYVRKATERFGT